MVSGAGKLAELPDSPNDLSVCIVGQTFLKPFQLLQDLGNEYGFHAHVLRLQFASCGHCGD